MNSAFERIVGILKVSYSIGFSMLVFQLPLQRIVILPPNICGANLIFKFSNDQLAFANPRPGAPPIPVFLSLLQVKNQKPVRD
jgi:hypothetical protein